ncbi:hypothetical protein ACHAWF_008804 [Thalassiosira exigua]
MSSIHPLQAPLMGDVGAAESQKKSRPSLVHSLTRDKSDHREKPFVIVVALVAALGGLIFGFDTGGSGMTFNMTYFRAYFGWDTAPQSQIDMEMGLINGLFGAGAAVGALIAPSIFNTRGRKSTMAWGAVLFTIGASLQAAAVNMPMLYVPRLLSGAGIGMLSMCSPVYIAEVAPESHRGQLATLWQLAIVIGILLVSVLNIPLSEWTHGWRISYGGNIVFSVALLAILTIMPESPHFLVTKERHDDAHEALSKVRFEDQIQWEIEQLEMEARESKARGEATWGQVFDNEDNKMKRRVLKGILLQSIQQLAGINAIIFYAPSILEDFFGPKGGMYGALALNVVNFLSTFITMLTIEKFGRVFILFTGALLMSAALTATAVLSSLNHGGSSMGLGIGITVFCALYIVGFAYSWGPVVWVVCAEMFPLRERGKATSLTTFSNWFWTTVVGAIFPMAKTASLAGCFGFFAGVTFLASIFVYFYLPETSDRTAPEIDEEFNTHKSPFPRKKWS